MRRMRRISQCFIISDLHYATDIRMRAERRAGELLHEMKETVGGGCATLKASYILSLAL
jgi:hypothetical protein